MRGYPVQDIQRYCDEVKGRGRLRQCAHGCGAETEGEYCEKCAPFYQEKRSEFQKMLLFKQEWAGPIWAETMGRFCLYFSYGVPDNADSLKLINVQEGDLVEKWYVEPALDEVVSAMYGACSCKPNSEPCDTCITLQGLLSDDELPS